MTGLLMLAEAESPVNHVIDHPWFGSASEIRSMFDPHWLLSNVVFMLFVCAAITAAIVIPAAKKIATGGEGRTADDFRAQGVWANFVEMICLYLREEVFRPMLHKKTDQYMPILWTFFWFILVCNLMGLVPLVDLTGGLLHSLFGIEINHGHGIGGTATQSIWVTGALAFLAFIVINLEALITDPKGYFKHLTGGVEFSLPMLPVLIAIILVEFIGIFVKPFALAVRLFANMTGGHMLLAVLLIFVKGLVESFGVGGGGAIALVPLAAATVISLLEVLVAVIQAFIFTALTGLFLGQLLHHEGDHEMSPEDYEEKPGLEHGPLL